MRTSQYLLCTLKETPAEAQTLSHQLMLRAGLIRKLASGLYTWLPTGLRVLRKVEAVVREEMNRAGAQEVLMPVVQPAELWEETGRWDKFGPQLLQVQDRHGRAFCIGPTHEEVITDLVRSEVQSHNQLPLNLYQVQTKFRDEIRPRFGVMRAREFVMKDAYSFHTSLDSLEQTYTDMYAAYSRVFSRLGLDFRAVLADTGAIGGSASHEFHVLAESGEDEIAFSDASDYAANVELAEAVAPPSIPPNPNLARERIATPGVRTIEQLCALLDTPATHTVKTLVVEGANGHPLVALVVRGDHRLNPTKAEKLAEVAVPLRMATEDEIRAAVGCGPGSLGPSGIALPVIVDRSAAALGTFIAGANEDGFHHQNLCWERDCSILRVEDIRHVEAGDPSPDGKGHIQIRRGIEVGHIFQLGTVYSEAMNAQVQGPNGSSQVLQMGCYGIGVSRVVAAAIEQHHDDRGIVWPPAIAPFMVAIVPIAYQKSDAVRETCDGLYAALQNQGIEALLDDRDERPGVKFADIELLGIPHRIVIGERGLKTNTAEYQGRRDETATSVPIEEVEAFLSMKVQQHLEEPAGP